MKKRGKFIITLVSRFNSACIDGCQISPNVYKWKDPNITGEAHVYVAKNEDEVRNLLKMFKINEIGYFDNYYCGIAGHHWVVLGEK